MTSTILSQSELAALVTQLVEAGTSVIAPVSPGADWERTVYQSVERLEDAAFGGALPRSSLTEFFTDASRARSAIRPQVILGARPCDAAALETLDEMLAWEKRDEAWLARREATTIVTLACTGGDDSCFCSAVGLGPDSTRGSDVLLVPLDGAWEPTPGRLRIVETLRHSVDIFLVDCEPFPGAAELQAQAAAPPPGPALGYLAQAITPKGDALLRRRGRPSSAADFRKAEAFVTTAREAAAAHLDAIRLPARNEPLRDAEADFGIAAADGGVLLAPALFSKRLPDWLAANACESLWNSLDTRCKGCGNCEAVCSTSHSFGAGPAPAGDGDTARFRHRVMHKFCTYPRHFDAIACTGCGRCARACEGGIRLPKVLGRLAELAGSEAPGTLRAR